jgi:uncharacterized protein (DUF1330 family)
MGQGRRIGWALVGMCLALWSAGPEAGAVDSPGSRKSLQGVKRIAVVVEGKTPALERQGVGTQQLRTAAELRLRKAGLPVAKAKAQAAYLSVSVSVLDVAELPAYACSVAVELYQPVSLQRDPQILVLSSTWSTGKLVILGEDRLREVREIMEDAVDTFIAAYRAANPHHAAPAK